MSRGSAGIFVLCLLVHVVAIATLLQATPDITPPSATPEPPKLQGMLIAPEPKIAAAPVLPQTKIVPPVQTAPPLKTTPTKPVPQPKPVPKQVSAKPKPLTPPPVTQAAAAAPVTAAEPSKVEPSKVTSTAPAASPAATQTELPSADAAGLNNKAPVYPLLSRKRKEQGTVWLTLLVSKDGRVTTLKLQKTSGFARLDQAAMQAVRHWTFQPARKAGQPIDYWYELPVKFSLNQS